MTIIRFGYRWYEIESNKVTAATAIWANCTGDQDDFETELEAAGIDFYYDFWED